MEIGMGTDCLSVVDPDDCDGLQVTGTTVFNLNGGTLISQGLTSVQPTTFGSADASHITGAIPQDGEENVLYGDGIYEGVTGSARLSGAVNMVKLESDGEIMFDCIFILYLDNLPEEEMSSSQALKSTDNQKLLLQLKGTGTAEMRTSPAPDSDEELPCFDVPLFDLTTGQQIGSGTDCLSVAGPDNCGGLQVTGTTVFNLDGGTLISQGLTSVQPTTFGSADATHITGAIPKDGEENILYGDGIYDGATGSARLSGAVNMAKLESDGEIMFDCIFIVDVALSSSPSPDAAAADDTSGANDNVNYSLVQGLVALMILFTI